MSDPWHKEFQERARAISSSRASVESERARCIAICESWIGTFQGTDIKYTTPRKYAIDAIEDIIDLIRDGSIPAGPFTNSPELLERAEKYLAINTADGRGSGLLVMELADALRAALASR